MSGALYGYTQGRIGVTFCPEALDNLEPRSYDVRARLKDMQRSWPFEQTLHQPVVLRSTRDGMVADSAFWGLRLPFDRFSVQRRRAIAPLLAALSHEVGADGRVTGVPTPNTLKQAAADHDMSIRLIRGAGKIPTDRYAQVFANYEYPVATKLLLGLINTPCYFGTRLYMTVIRRMNFCPTSSVLIHR